MNWMDHITDLVFEKDSVGRTIDPKPVPNAILPHPVTISTPLRDVFGSSTNQSSTPSAESTQPLDQTAVGGFIKRLKINIGPSPAIEKFQSTLEALAETIPDTQNRIRTSLTVLEKTTGISAADLTESFNTQLNKLELESGKFRSALDSQRKTAVGDREDGIHSLESQIACKRTEIESLTKQHDDLAGELVIQKSKLDSVQTGFDQAVGDLTKQLQTGLDSLRTITAISATGNQQ